MEEDMYDHRCYTKQLCVNTCEHSIKECLCICWYIQTILWQQFLMNNDYSFLLDLEEILYLFG